MRGTRTASRCTSKGIANRVPRMTRGTRFLAPITVRESRLIIFYVLQCILVRPIFAMRTFVVRPRTNVQHRVRYLSPRLSHCMITRAANEPWCRSPAARAGAAPPGVGARSQERSGDTDGAVAPSCTGRFSRHRGRDVTAASGSQIDAGRTGCPRSRSHWMSIDTSSRGMFTRFDCMVPQGSVHPRLRSHRLRAASDGTAPTAPPGERPGVSLHNWS